MFAPATVVTLLAFALSTVRAETHTVHFTNNCGFGTPTLIQGPNVLSTGGDFTINGPLISAIAYLQTGGCGFNGENCVLVETTLENGFSSTDLSLIPPHAFQVTTGFGYFNGCNGAGADCQEPNCPAAFESPDQTFKQVGCPAANVNLAITFCD
ncbi:glycopeptide [Roridomyces roridus]|uniref:Glycopeptide n=1 Tax=Roridomyces roridus TaxID=1738132 RepID=A0AAD7BCQ0_9AGAR|nr:glycopeptide [Roridomyces roridus]